MQQKDINEFVHVLNYGDEMCLLYQGKRYIVQGFTEDDQSKLSIVRNDGINNEHFWECMANSMVECASKFLEEKLWNGKMFHDAANEIKWANW